MLNYARSAQDEHIQKLNPHTLLPGGQTARPQDTLHERYTLPGVGYEAMVDSIG